MTTIKVDDSGARAVIEGIKFMPNAVRQKLLPQLGALQVRHINQRARAGLDFHDRAYPKSKKIARGLGGTTLFVTGNMLAALRVSTPTSNAVEITVGSGIDGQKWLWAQEGTKPHKILPRIKKALAFGTSMSNANAMAGSGRVTRADGTSYRKTTRLTMANARSNAEGMAIVRGVNHPGTPPRPLFGISPADAARLKTKADSFVNDYMKTVVRKK